MVPAPMAAIRKHTLYIDVCSLPLRTGPRARREVIRLPRGCEIPSMDERTRVPTFCSSATCDTGAQSRVVPAACRVAHQRAPDLAARGLYQGRPGTILFRPQTLPPQCSG